MTDVAGHANVFLATTGSTGFGGTGGNTGGTGGGASQGKTAIEFTVVGGPYCTDLCGTGPSIEIANPSGKSLVLTSNCFDVECSTCSRSTSPCPPILCPNVGINVTGAKMDWDGISYATSTCGSGTSCVEPIFASPGKYTATFCATPGKLVGPDGGIPQCWTSGPAKCGSVEFDFPSSTVAKGTVGP